MVEEDLSYLEQRAEAELELAQKATDPQVVKVHYELADLYLERLHNNQNRDKGGSQ
jgi:hypothetical protein